MSISNIAGSISFPTSGTISTGASEFTPLDFFSAGANGLWYDNDPSTWFEDSAMTIPATFGNPIGAWVDKSPNGINGLQAVSGSRLTYGRMPYGGVRNQLLNTAVMSTQSRVVSAVQKTLSFTGTGTITLTGASIAGPLIGTGASNRVSLTFTPTAGTLTMTVVGDVRMSQLEDDALSAYQQVVLGWDVTESGVASVASPWFDGVNDYFDLTASGASLVQNVGQFIVCGAINSNRSGSAINHRASIFASNTPTANYARALMAIYINNTLESGGRRTDLDAFDSTTAPAMNFANSVFTSNFLYSSANLSIRKNGAQVANDPTFQTAGVTDNTAASAVYVGREESIYFGGFIPSVFAIADTALSDAQLLQLETYMANQIGVIGL